ncbi:protein RIK isoform X1 [Vitis vinifera]|nr:protein RIK isoform X1 [Vitis vinifera]|eukprot:XP_010660599.1 PREDICTED: protein RIK isoform X1 [Vitis vinifera]
MIEDSCPRPASSDEASAIRQRKKRKWDQPAESLVSAGVALPGVLPLGNVGPLVGIPLAGVAPPSSALLTNVTIPPVFQTSSIQQHASAIVQKLNQPKIQDELIAREIIINDAESTVRYKLTKRQMQEEIQKCTGAVVITRGKYRPPNALPDGEKPLYLHISAGAHLKDTAERIKAVDRAAAMVEEMLKQGQNSESVPSNSHLAGNTGVTQAPSTCVFLGFEADPSLNIAACIRGPNDQYINHIMNETGATVSLRGRGSGNSESPNGEGQQPLHLFLSSNNLKGLEDAKLLAENLLDTICAECGASRASSCKVYGAVPPPQQLLVGVQSSGNELNVKTSSTACLASSAVSSTPTPLVSPLTVPGVSTGFSQGAVSQCGGFFNSGQPQSNLVCYPPPSLTAGTSYSGYGGIYPQATPLQQVALALRQSPSPVTSTIAPSTSSASTVPMSSAASFSEKEKRLPQRRKFQELPVALKGPTKPQQGLQLPSETTSGLTVRNSSTMPAPRKLVQPSSSGMPPPPPKGTMGPLPPPPPKFSSPARTMAPPPPPPKFNSSTTIPEVDDKNVLNKSKSDTVPDTLSKLMEYGEEDDDPDEAGEESCKNNSSVAVAPKPFWAV